MNTLLTAPQEVGWGAGGRGGGGGRGGELICFSRIHFNGWFNSRRIHCFGIRTTITTTGPPPSPNPDPNLTPAYNPDPDS